MAKTQIESTNLCTSFVLSEYQQKFRPFHQSEGEITTLWSQWGGVVLLLKVEQSLVIVKRSQHVSSHRGHVAFIGGKKEPYEHHPVEVALREFEEETHLSSSLLQIHGGLPFVRTSTSQCIWPLMATLNLSKEHFLSQIHSNGEWDHVFLVDFKNLYDSSRWSFAHYESEQSLLRPVYFRSFLRHEVEGHTQFFDSGLDALVLWGASAKMVIHMITINPIIAV